MATKSKGSDFDYNTKFIKKMFFNVLKSLVDNKLEFGLFYKSLCSNCRSEIIPDEAIDYVELCDRRFQKKNGERDYYPFYEILEDRDRRKIVNIIKKHHPDITDNYQIPVNIKYFAKLLDFDKNEIVLFYFYSMIAFLDNNHSRALMSLQFAFRDLISFYNACFLIDKEKLGKIFTLNTNLLTSGILKQREEYSFKGHYDVIDKVSDLLSDANLNDEKLIKVLFPSKLDTTLDLDDYEHIESDVAILSDVINNALKKRTNGINALLWGYPGTGKTELPLLLAKQHGWDLRVIGDIDDADDSEKSRNERLLSLKLAQKLFKHRNETNKKIVLMFDEMEDLFKMDMNANFSKAFINRIIEKTRTPIIWTTNSLNALGDAVIRRMTFAIEFEIPKVAARRKIWKKCNKIYKLKLSDESIEELATTYEVVPALIVNTCKVANLSGVGAKQVTRVIENLDTAMNYGRKRRRSGSDIHTKATFITSLSNADLSLDDMVENISRRQISNFSICAYGPPGTGKSAFGRHLARKMDKQVLFKRTSDIQSMWVGECEKNMADMFETAKDEEKFLILDEADTFLRSREMARNSWEISQANEMLTQMETHTQPFFCTTNLMDTLDGATLRRFTFKIKFDFLHPNQLSEAFEFFFGVGAPANIHKLSILTPGDFANVKTKIEILGISKANEILDYLINECELKPQYTKPMGFQTPIIAHPSSVEEEKIVARKGNKKSLKMRKNECKKLKQK